MTTRGGLACREVDWIERDSQPAAVAVLAHGFGAPATDLVSLAAEIARCRPELVETTRFVFPAALLSLDAQGLYGGRAWWHLDLNRIVAAIERGEKRILCDEVPEGLEPARSALEAAIEELRTETGLPLSKFVLGGFSQGSMLATDVALRLPETAGGLVVWSGTLLCQPEWRKLAASRAGMPVVQSHGRQDPILPFEGAEWLRDLLTEAELRVDFLPFSGGHQIPLEAVERAADLIARVAES